MADRRARWDGGTESVAITTALLLPYRLRSVRVDVVAQITVVGFLVLVLLRLRR